MEFGKTTFISILAKLMKNRRVLIIDFDFINKSLNTILGVCSVPKDIKEKIRENEFLSEFRLKEANLEKLIVKVNRKIDLISKGEIIFDEQYDFKEEKMKEILERFKEKYDLILIDTNEDTKYERYIQKLSKVSDKIICLVEGNLISIQKTINILNKHVSQKDKIKIIYNKKNKFTVDKRIIELIFFKFKLIGTLHYDNRYNKIINKNVNTLYIPKKVKKEFEKVIIKL